MLLCYLWDAILSLTFCLFHTVESPALCSHLSLTLSLAPFSLIHRNTPDPSTSSPFPPLLFFATIHRSHSSPGGLPAPQIISQAPGAWAGPCLFSFPSWRTSNLEEREGDQMTTGSWPFLPQFNSSPSCPLNVAIRLGRSDTLIWAWPNPIHNHGVTFHLYVGAVGNAGVGDSGGVGGEGSGPS